MFAWIDLFVRKIFFLLISLDLERLYLHREKIIEYHLRGHVALVSLDIRAAFNGMDWGVLLQTLAINNFPRGFIWFIYSYLADCEISASVSDV